MNFKVETLILRFYCLYDESYIITKIDFA